MSDTSDKRVEKLKKDFARNRVFDIGEKGRGEAFVIREVTNAMHRIPASYASHQEMAKPGTINDSLAARAYVLAMETANPNNVDPHMFLGSYELEREAMAMTARLLHCPDPAPGKPDEEKHYAGWFLNGGTESIIQAAWIYRNKYFFERFRKVKLPKYIKESGKGKLFRDLFSIRKRGWFGVYREYQKFFDGRGKTPTPKIVAPINAHFAVDKAAEILGFGQENVARFYLKEDGRPDAASLRETMLDIVENGDEIAMIWLVVGGTERGVLADVGELVGKVRDIIKKQDYEPPVLIDAAAQYLFAAVMRQSENYTDAEGLLKTVPDWDFRVPEVQAIVCDAHKNQIPYPASILLLRDPKDAAYTMMEEAYLSLDLLREEMDSDAFERSQDHATIPTSRAGYGVVATWAYYVGHGLAEIRRRKEKIWSLVMRLREAIARGELSSIYELMCEPDSALVTFCLRQDWLEKRSDRVQDILDESGIEAVTPSYLNMRIYESINQSEDDFFYIARSTALGLTTEQTYREYRRKKDDLRYGGKEEDDVYDYMGLMAHIMEHTREEDIDLLIKKLREAAERLTALPH